MITIEDRAEDPVAVIRDILAAGPVPAPLFRRLAHERGVPVKEIPKATKALGAQCHRNGAPGKAGRGNGGWVWVLDWPYDHFIVKKPGRKGYYANNLYFRGKEIQHKLADDIDAARLKIAEVIADLERKRAAEPPPATGQRRERVPMPVHVRLRNLIRQRKELPAREFVQRLFKLCGKVKALESRLDRTGTTTTKGKKPCAS
jgi:hypothetical protein